MSSFRVSLSIRWPSFKQIVTIASEPRVFTADVLSLLLPQLLPRNSCSFVPLRLLVSKTCSRTSIVSSQVTKWLRPKMASLLSRSLRSVLSPGTPTFSVHSPFCGDRDSLSISARFHGLTPGHTPGLSGQRPVPSLSGLCLAGAGAGVTLSSASLK